MGVDVEKGTVEKGTVPYILWFYFERYDHLDVVRMLGERQDIASILAAGLD